MNRIEGKQIIITGASSGIGRVCAEKCAAMKANLILLARRMDRLMAMKEDLEGRYGISVMARQVDIGNRKVVQEFARELISQSIYPDVLINNAGMASGHSKLHEGDFDAWDKMIDTNIKGLLNVSRTILPLMVEKNRGHVVNISSIAGHQIYPGGNVYSATKFFTRVLTEGMNIDLMGTKIRVSCISPGMVNTEFPDVWFNGDKEMIAKVYSGYQPLAAEDVADAILYIINAPEHVNVFEMFILPTAQRNSYCLHRERK
ncbi:MAG: SDR family NAD(P)-dependent oxidoreductase [Pseudomonadota bacterium]